VVGVSLSGEGVEDQLRPGKRVEGIEPSSLAWKAIALPLSYTRMRSCGPAMSRTCPRVPLLDGPCSLGVFLVVGLWNREGGNEARCRNVGLKQISWSLASFLAFAVYRCDLLRYRYRVQYRYRGMGLEVGSAGFEPAKAEPLDLQSSPFDRSGNFPHVLVISVRIQISPNQNLPRERHRFFRTGATIFLDPAPLRISHSEAGRAQNERRVDDPVNDRPISCLLRLQRD
jgi:hypothetical protein